MNSGNLQAWQIERLQNRIKRDLHYLDCLSGRMSQKHFPQTDPLLRKVEEARQAMAALATELDRLQAF